MMRCCWTIWKNCEALRTLSKLIEFRSQELKKFLKKSQTLITQTITALSVLLLCKRIERWMFLGQKPTPSSLARNVSLMASSKGPKHSKLMKWEEKQKLTSYWSRGSVEPPLMTRSTINQTFQPQLVHPTTGTIPSHRLTTCSHNLADTILRLTPSIL